MEKEKAHGFYILKYGRHRCNKHAGGHFNPINSKHGSAESCYRHHGDLEPITSDEFGQVQSFIQWDPRVKLQVSENHVQ